MILKVLRKKTKLVIWGIIVAFCLWGAFSVGVQIKQGGHQAAGRVFGKTVSYQEFDRMERATRLFSLTGARIEDAELLRQQTWQNIIFAHESRQRKLKVSDDDVREELKRLLAAYQIPANAPGVYANWVRSISASTPRDFEEMVREMLRVQKLLQNVRRELEETPSRNDILTEFLRQNRQLGGEVFRFATHEEAGEFLQKARAAQGAAESILPTKLELTAAKNIQADYLLSNDATTRLAQTTLNQLTEPIPCRGSACVFRLTDRKEADPALLNAEDESKKIEDALKEKKTSARFLIWSQALLTRAQLKDEMPAPSYKN